MRLPSPCSAASATSKTRSRCWTRRRSSSAARSFQQKQAAIEDLRWCQANIAKAPDVGWLREVDFRLGKLALADGEGAAAKEFLRQSGYKSFEKPIVLTTPF